MAENLPAPTKSMRPGRKMAKILPAPAEGDGQVLTEREGQILLLIAAGLSSPQIADKIHLSFTTIKWYRKKLLLKFDAANTAELISKAKGKGLI